MLTVVRIPLALRPKTGGADVITTAGETLGLNLRDLCFQHPELETTIFNTDGQLVPHIKVFVNDEDVAYSQGLNTPISTDDIICLMINAQV